MKLHLSTCVVNAPVTSIKEEPFFSALDVMHQASNVPFCANSESFLGNARKPSHEGKLLDVHRQSCATVSGTLWVNQNVPGFGSPKPALFLGNQKQC